MRHKRAEAAMARAAHGIAAAGNRLKLLPAGGDALVSQASPAPAESMRAPRGTRPSRLRNTAEARAAAESPFSLELRHRVSPMPTWLNAWRCARRDCAASAPPGTCAHWHDRHPGSFALAFAAKAMMIIMYLLRMVTVLTVAMSCGRGEV